MQKVLFGHQKSLSRTSPMEKIAGVLMSWYDSQAGIPRDQLVDVLESYPSGSVIRSTVEIPLETRVYLNTGVGVLDGFVVSCQADNVQFVLTIEKLCSPMAASAADSVDPGVLNVESFLTAAQEDALLAEVADCEYNAVHESSLSKPESASDEARRAH